MALIVEDGTIVANADSYVSVADARTFLASRGESFTADDTVAEQNLLKAMDELEAMRSQFKGSKTDIVTPQALQWPRQDVTIDGEDFDENTIPVELVRAQCYLALYAQTYDLSAVGTGKIVLREKVDVIEREYADSKSGTVQAIFNKVEDMLAPLLINGGMSLSTIRL